MGVFALNSVIFAYRQIFTRQSMNSILATTPLMGVIALLAAFTYVWLETEFC
jgi:hypothetical protein